MLICELYSQLTEIKKNQFVTLIPKNKIKKNSHSKVSELFSQLHANQIYFALTGVTYHEHVAYHYGGTQRKGKRSVRSWNADE